MKSRATSFILTFLLGALGVMYTSISISLLLLVATAISLPTGIGPIVIWIVAIFWGDALVKKHNAELQGMMAQPHHTIKRQSVDIAARMGGKPTTATNPAQELPKIVTEGVKLPKVAQYAANILLGVAAIFAVSMVLLIAVAVVQTVSSRIDVAEVDTTNILADAERKQSKLCKLLGGCGQ